MTEVRTATDDNELFAVSIAPTEEELKERRREYQRKYRLKKHGEPVKKAPLTDEEKALKKQKSIEYQRKYRADNADALKALNITWRVKNADKLNDKRINDKPKYAAIQRAYDQKMRNDPHYIALNDARQKRYRDRKKMYPELYKQKEPKAAKPKGRPKTRGIVEPIVAN
jgi:hypothetical protein